MEPDPKSVVARYLEAAYGGGTTKHIAPRGGVWLARLGGLSPVPQTNDRAPVPRGYWAFLWPYIEPFLVGSTDDFGPVHSYDEATDTHKSRPSRYELNKARKIRLRKFKYEGLLWTQWAAAHRFSLQQKNGWFLVDARDLATLARAQIHRLHSEWAALNNEQGASPRVIPRGSHLPYSKDDMEVFVPANQGRVVGKPPNHPSSQDWDEDGEGDEEPRVASAIKVDTSRYEKILQEKISELIDWSSRKDSGDALTEEVGERTLKKLLADTAKNMASIAQKLNQTVAQVPNWNGSPLSLRPHFDTGWDFDFENGAKSATVFVGREANFTYFFDDTIDDVLEAGDTEFFRDQKVEMDYFGLVEEIRHPGRAERESHKFLKLWTARPEKDAVALESASTIPSRIFLSSRFDDAAGIAVDFGKRDLYEVVIQAQYVMETLSTGSLRHYQTIVTPSGKVPVKSITKV